MERLDRAYGKPQYNKHISRLATVQEHRMITKAIERGVSEKRIAKALNIRIETLRPKNP